MSKAIELPDEVYEAVSKAARQAGKTADELIASSLRERYLGTGSEGGLARRKVNGFLLRNIGEMLCAGSSVEREDCEGRSYWKVPVWVATPDRGPIEEIGAIRVDIQIDELMADATECARLASKARLVLTP